MTTAGWSTTSTSGPAPRNAKLICEKIAAALSEADPEGEAEYNAALESYCAELDELDAAFTDVVANGVRNTIVFGDRFPLLYFAKAYGLEYYAAWPGCADEAEPSAATVAFLIDKVNEEHIPVVFHIELSNEDMADTICEATARRSCSSPPATTSQGRSSRRASPTSTSCGRTWTR